MKWKKECQIVAVSEVGLIRKYGDQLLKLIPLVQVLADCTVVPTKYNYLRICCIVLFVLAFFFQFKRYFQRDIAMK